MSYVAILIQAWMDEAYEHLLTDAFNTVFVWVGNRDVVFLWVEDGLLHCDWCTAWWFWRCMGDRPAHII
jgi:hypothetical protein